MSEQGQDDTEHPAPPAKRRRSSDLQTLLRVLREARPYRGLLLLSFLLGLLAAPLALLQPVPLKVIIDSVLGSVELPGFLHDWFSRGPDGYGASLLVVAVVAQAVVILLAQLQSVANSLLQVYVGEKISLGFRAKLLNHVQRLSFAFHDRRGTHDSIYRIQYDATSIQGVAVYSVISFVAASITLVSMVVVMFRIDLELALVSMSVLPLLFGFSRAYAKRMKPRYKHVKDLESSALGVVQEILTGFRVVKAFGREQHEQQRFLEHSSASVRERVRLGIAEGAFGLLVGGTTALGTAAVIYIGVRNVQEGSLKLGELLMIVSYLAQLYGPVKTISKNVSGLQKQLASAERAFELLDEVPHIAEKPHAAAIGRARGAIAIDHVSFAYDGQNNVLQDVSFAVRPGERIGIVGRTGAGKTTLVSLLTRFYAPDAGSILLDGRDLSDYKLADLRNQFSIVLQEPVLFSTSIADNIAYARPDASMDEIVSAAKAAGAHDFIVRMDDGYDTVVGERGNRLSGGERQRISLARAFLKNAPILVLDEPTSSVDVETEASIMGTMERLMEGRTTFMIAHRLSTLRGCDRLLELSDKQVTVREPLARLASEGGAR